MGFFAATFNFSWWYLLIVYLTKGPGFAKIGNIFGNFFNCAFHLVFAVATTNLSFYCSHFECPEIWHADVFWPPSELSRFWSSCCVSSFWCHFDLVKQVIFGVSGDFFRMHGRNGFKFDMLIYPDYLVNCLHFGHGLLMFTYFGSILT